MIENQPTVPSPKNKNHWPSLLVMVNAGLGLMFFFGIAGIIFLSGFANLFRKPPTPNETAALFSYAAAGLFLGLLLLPSVVLAINRIRGGNFDQSPFWAKTFVLLHPKRLIWLYPLVVIAGHYFTDLPPFNWLVMPVLNVLAFSIPVAWLVWIGSRRLNLDSRQRNWSTFGIGITFSPLVIMVIEILMIIFGFFLVVILLSTVLEGNGLELESLFSALTQQGELRQISEQETARFLRQPLVLTMILLFISGFVPLLEELIKPAAVWLMWRKPLTPQDGWILGLLSGAGFALLENLGNLNVGEGWAFLVLARMGASALHIFNTAIISYTVVLARQTRRILPAVLAVLGAILIHGIWNGLTIFATLSSLESNVSSTQIWPVGFIVILAGISVCLVGGIFLINQRLFNQQVLATSEEADPPNKTEDSLPKTMESEQ